MGLDKWNTLPKDLQELVMQAYWDTHDARGKYWVEFNSADLQKMEDAGEVPVTFPPDEAKKFLDLAISATSQYVIKQYPVTAPKILEMGLE